MIKRTMKDRIWNSLTAVFHFGNLPVVLSDSSAPVQVVSSASSPDSPSSHKWTVTEPVHSEASPPSLHKPFSSSARPQADARVLELPPGPPQVASPWGPARPLWFLIAPVLALRAPAQSSAPHLKQKKKGGQVKCVFGACRHDFNISLG